MLDAGGLDALWRIADELGIAPQSSLPVMWIESELQTTSHRSGADFYGLNQISGRWLRAAGVDPAAYLQWPAAEQLRRTVLPYWRWAGTYGSISDAATLMWAQLAPASLSRATSDDAVVFASPSIEYTANKWLDLAGDGSITLGDLRAVTTHALHTSQVQSQLAAAAARRRAPTPATVAAAGISSGPSLVIGAALGLAAAAAYAAREGALG